MTDRPAGHEITERPPAIPFTPRTRDPRLERGASDYATYQSSPPLTPPWLAFPPNAKTWLEAFGSVKDWMTWVAACAVLIHWIRYADADALGLVGVERRLARHPNEVLNAYRARLLDAWGFWRQGGTRPGMLRALAVAGYRAELVEHGCDPPLGDSDREYWSEFSIDLYPLVPAFISRRWGDGLWGDGTQWGTTIADGERERIMSIIRQMKSGHSRLRRLRYINTMERWGPQANWGDPGRVWGQGSWITLHPIGE